MSIVNKNIVVQPTLGDIYNILIKDGIYLEHQELEKRIASLDYSDRSLAALNIGFLEAKKLFENHHSLTELAKIIEKIQIAAAETERFAAMTKADQQAFYYNHLAQRIADISRSYFHKIKEASEAA